MERDGDHYLVSDFRILRQRQGIIVSAMSLNWIDYILFVIQIISCITFFIVLALMQSPHRDREKSIQFMVTLCLFIFSATGSTLSCFAVLEQQKKNSADSTRNHSTLIALNSSFINAAFAWIITLACSSLQSDEPRFKLSKAHAIIWPATTLHFILSTVYTLSLGLRMFQTLLSVLTLVAAMIATIVSWRCCSSNQTSFPGLRRSSSTNSSINERHYMAVEFICIAPSAVLDFLSLLSSNHSSSAPNSIGILCLCFLPLSWYCLTLYEHYYPSSSMTAILESETSTTLGNNIPHLVGLEIGDKIGQGIAVVYKGKWRGATVAVKTQPLFLTSEFIDHECNSEIQAEAALMKSLTHPNIVLFMDVGIYNGSMCIITEYCSRGSLRDVIESSSQPMMKWPMKLRLAIGIASGLAYLHQSVPKMIHRDLKSPNIVVDESWHAKIADFGTLRFSEIIHRRKSRQPSTSSSTTMTGLVGSTRWMAPEVIRSEKQYDEKIDIYSFGLILWELIEGEQLPFNEFKWNHDIEKVILSGKRPIIKKDACPARWKVLVTMCWQPDPTQRPSIRQVLRTLQLVAREEIWEKPVDDTNNSCKRRLDTALDSLDCNYILNHTSTNADAVSSP